MQSTNIAYTDEYLNYKSDYDYLFDDIYRTDEEIYVLSDDRHIMRVIYYEREIIKKNMIVSKIILTDRSGNQIIEMKNIGEKVFWYSEIEHSNGNRYLIYSLDLYGYSIMDMANYKTYNYIPEQSFKGGETFIWTGAYYCKQNNLIAADGCYWACPNSLEFYDFSNPNKLSLKYICSSYDLENELNIDRDVTPVGWNEKGEFVLRCIVDDKEVDKSINLQSCRGD